VTADFGTHANKVKAGLSHPLGLEVLTKRRDGNGTGACEVFRQICPIFRTSSPFLGQARLEDAADETALQVDL
jgi:hypothetical protein